MANIKCSIYKAGILLIGCAALFPNVAWSQVTGQRYAIVIGVDKYASQVTDFRDLDYAEKDANAIIDVLIDKFAFT